MSEESRRIDELEARIKEQEQRINKLLHIIARAS